MRRNVRILGLLGLLGIAVLFSFVLPVAGDNCSDPTCWGECVNKACAKCETVCGSRNSYCFQINSMSSECIGGMCCTDFLFQCGNMTFGHHVCCSFSICCRL